MENLVKKVNKWTSEIARELCKSCKSSCCSAIKHQIEIKENEINPFIQRCIPIISSQQKTRKKDAAYLIKKTIRDEEGVKNKYLIYPDHSGYCPLYDQERKICKIHNDPQRPKVCKEFPLFQLDLKQNLFLLSRSCKPFNNPEIIKNFIERFPEARLKTYQNGMYEIV